MTEIGERSDFGDCVAPASCPHLPSCTEQLAYVEAGPEQRGELAVGQGHREERLSLQCSEHNTGDMSFPVTGTHSGSVRTQHLCSKRDFY